MAFSDSGKGLTDSAGIYFRRGAYWLWTEAPTCLYQGETQERGIVGEIPNLAARLQGIAEPNIVVICDSTPRLVGNLFELARRAGITGAPRRVV